MFLEKKWKYCQAFQRFLALSKVKAFTRDQFMNIIEFSRDVTSFEDYDDSGACKDPNSQESHLRPAQLHNLLYNLTILILLFSIFLNDRACSLG